MLKNSLSAIKSASHDRGLSPLVLHPVQYRGKTFWLSGSFLVWYFRDATRSLVGYETLEDELYVGF